MNTFNLRIATPDGVVFDGEAKSVTARTIAGDVGIMAGHAEYAAALAPGTLKVTAANGDTKTAGCTGGVLSVVGGVVRIAADASEWKDIVSRT